LTNRTIAPNKGFPYVQYVEASQDDSTFKVFRSNISIYRNPDVLTGNIIPLFMPL